MINLGNKKVKLYLGDKKVKAAWLGTKKVYPNSFLELSASSLSFAAAGQAQQLAITVNDGQTWTIAALPAGFSVSASSGTGPATVTVTAANNTSTTARTGALTVNSEDLSAVCSLSQTAGTKVYGAWQNVSLTIDTTSFAASGGTSAMRVNVKRTWTWNGVAGSGGTETSTSSLASPSTSDNIASVSGNTLTVGSLGTTFKASKTITVSAQTAHDATRVSATVTQAANYVTSINSLKTRTLTYSQIGAGGGTSDCQWDSYSGTAMNTLWSCTFASGATGNAADADAVGNFRQIGMSYSWTGPSGTITSLNGSTGAITAISRGTTVGNDITVTVNAIQTVVFDNPSFVGGSTTPVLQQPATGTCTQKGNAVTNTTQSGGAYTYGNVTAGTITNAVVPAGGTATGQTYTATAGNGSQSWSRTAIIATDTYTSGDKAQRTVQAASSGTNAVAPSPASLNSGSVASKGQVQSGQTVVKSTTVTWAANGKSATGTMYVYQQENEFITQTSSCDGYRRYGIKTYTSGNYEYSEENSYYCGYQVTISLNVSVTQSGILVSPVFKSLQAWACRTGNVQGQGTSTVTFSNPKFGNNAATLSLSESEKNYGYVLFQLQMTYTDSGGAGALPNYVWSGAVTYSGSLAIYTKANAMNANVTVSAATRSAAADAAVASDVPAASGSVAADATALLERIGSGELKVPDGLAERLREMADGTDDGK